MNPFLAAQARDPFDPMPMLIHADWLEERGDAAGAAVLRALAEVGTPSLHALALEVALRSSATRGPDEPEPGRAEGDGYGWGDGNGGEVGVGAGFGDRVEDWGWAGVGNGDEPGADGGSSLEAGFGEGDGSKYELGSWDDDEG